MDSLLEKLRAAAPQARDQRDRRRRARLQNKHQVRVASGQKIPDPDEIPEVEEGLTTSESVSAEGAPMSPDSTAAGSSGEGKDDVAERAALLLQGMRGIDGTDDAESERRDSVRRSRRRDTAEEERRARRRRRDRAGASTSDGLGTPGAIAEEPDEEAETLISDPQEADEGERGPTPTTVVSPPSPDGSEKKPIALDE